MAAATALLGCKAQNKTSLLPNYNGNFYPSVLAAAQGVGTPFLLEQGYMTMPGVTVKDSILTYNGTAYKVHEKYVNPVGPDTNYYYLHSGQYETYGINAFKPVWPRKIPNAFYNAAQSTFISEIDCVGYGTRLLSATGDTSVQNNAYRNLAATMERSHAAPFAANGYVAMAYQFAVAFPTLPTTAPQGSGWQYVSGNVKVDSIVIYDDKLTHNKISTYNGVPKGNFQASQPGDILSFGYGPTSKDNGHFMVISRQPYMLNADSLARYFPGQPMDNITQLLSAYRVYAVPVFDCSGINAHFFDSRNPPAYAMSGIGHGTIVILTSPQDDVPMGFIFGRAQAKAKSNNPVLDRDLVGQQVYALSVGRFTLQSAAH